MIKEWKQSEWLKKRKSLQTEIDSLNGFKHATVKRYDETILIEGGCIPIGFSDDGRVYVWKKGGCRYAGPRCYLDDLRNVESIILKWLDKQKEEENVVKNG